jgi:hypothetical protein
MTPSSPPNNRNHDPLGGPRPDLAAPDFRGSGAVSTRRSGTRPPYAKGRPTPVTGGHRRLHHDATHIRPPRRQARQRRRSRSPGTLRRAARSACTGRRPVIASSGSRLDRHSAHPGCGRPGPARPDGARTGSAAPAAAPRGEEALDQSGHGRPGRRRRAAGLARVPRRPTAPCLWRVLLTVALAAGDGAAARVPLTDQLSAAARGARPHRRSPVAEGMPGWSSPRV